MSKNLFVDERTSVEPPSVPASYATSVDDHDSVIESKALATFTDRDCSDDELLDTAECSDMFTTDAYHGHAHRRHGVGRHVVHSEYWTFYKSLKENADGNGKSANSFLMHKTDFPNANEQHRGRGFIGQIKNGSISIDKLKKHYAGFKNLLHVIDSKMKQYTSVSRKVKADVRNDIQFAVNFVDRNGKSGKSTHNGSKESTRGSVVSREFAKAQEGGKKEEAKALNEAKTEENKRFKGKIYEWGKKAVSHILRGEPDACDYEHVTRVQVDLVFGLILERCFKLHATFALKRTDVDRTNVMNVVIQHLVSRSFVIFKYTKQLTLNKGDCCGKYGFDGFHKTAAERKVEKEAMDDCLIRAAVIGVKAHIDEKIENMKARNKKEDAKIRERADLTQQRRDKEEQDIYGTRQRLTELQNKTAKDHAASRDDLIAMYYNGTVPIPDDNDMCPPGTIPNGGAGGGGPPNGSGEQPNAGGGGGSASGNEVEPYRDRSRSPSVEYSNDRSPSVIRGDRGDGARSQEQTPAMIGNGRNSGHKEDSSRIYPADSDRPLDRRRIDAAGNGIPTNASLLVNNQSVLDDEISDASD